VELTLLALLAPFPSFDSSFLLREWIFSRSVQWSGILLVSFRLPDFFVFAFGNLSFQYAVVHSTVTAGGFGPTVPTKFAPVPFANFALGNLLQRDGKQSHFFATCTIPSKFSFQLAFQLMAWANVVFLTPLPQRMCSRSTLCDWKLPFRTTQSLFSRAIRLEDNR
jgi:hypothetical protein